MFLWRLGSDQGSHTGQASALPLSYNPSLNGSLMWLFFFFSKMLYIWLSSFQEFLCYIFLKMLQSHLKKKQNKPSPQTNQHILVRFISDLDKEGSTHASNGSGFYQKEALTHSAWRPDVITMGTAGKDGHTLPCGQKQAAHAQPVHPLFLNLLFQ